LGWSLIESLSFDFPTTFALANIASDIVYGVKAAASIVEAVVMGDALAAAIPARSINAAIIKRGVVIWIKLGHA
jgi:hypothetical protein